MFCVITKISNILYLYTFITASCCSLIVVLDFSIRSAVRGPVNLPWGIWPHCVTLFQQLFILGQWVKNNSSNWNCSGGFKALRCNYSRWSLAQSNRVNISTFARSPAIRETAAFGIQTRDGSRGWLWIFQRSNLAAEMIKPNSEAQTESLESNPGKSLAELGSCPLFSSLFHRWGENILFLLIVQPEFCKPTGS